MGAVQPEQPLGRGDHATDEGAHVGEFTAGRPVAGDGVVRLTRGRVAVGVESGDPPAAGGVERALVPADRRGGTEPRRAEGVAGAESHVVIGGDREPSLASGDITDPAPVDEAELADEVVGDLDPREAGARGDEDGRRPGLGAVNAFLVDGDVIVAHTGSRVATLKSVAVRSARWTGRPEPL